MLDRLVLTDFRNHADLVLAPGAGLNILTGPNGAGKTNVLEAISLLTPGRGLRRAALSEMARQDGAGGFALSARTNGAVLGTGTGPDAPERRVTRINGASAATAALAEWLAVLWLTPAMDRLFTDAASERRRFLDRLVLALHPGHAGEVSRYEAAMRQRTRLLADAAPDPAWLDALETAMAHHGATIDAARRDTVTALAAAIAQSADADFPSARLSLGGGPAAAATLAAARGRDAAAGRALEGPHRSDLVVVDVRQDQPAARCSTGEQKALLLGIVLAHADLVRARTGRAAVLLLDEVAAHLDADRRAALFARLERCGQVWMTGTEAAPFAGITEAAWHPLHPR